MSDAIEVNVTGRLMLLLTRLRLLDNRCLSIYKAAVMDVVRHRLDKQGDGFAGIERVLDDELALLEIALHGSAARRRDPQAEEDPPADARDTEHLGSPAEVEKPSVPTSDEPASVPQRRESRAASGYVPTVKTMEEKLKDERKPVQTLLKEDCVRVGLIDGDRAGKLILGMTGKTSQQAEQDIVEYLRQRLQDQVKSFIRKAKGGPWSDPRTQEELRKDIHAAKSVRSILMLSRQVLKEYQTWQKENHRNGILGLFSPRKRIVER